MSSIHLTLAIATVGPALLCRCLGQALRTATGPLDVCLYGNGVKLDEQLLLTNSIYATLGEVEKRERHLHTDERIVRRTITIGWDERNRGVPYALHRLYELSRRADVGPADRHVILFIHDDVFLWEAGWDERVRAAFEDPRVELGGFLGAIGVGFENIYQISYESHHLARYGGMSNFTNAQAVGERITTERPAVYVDGMSMAIRRNALDDIGGFSWWPETIVHHGYDVAVACKVRRHGGRAVVIPVDCQHGVETASGLTSGTAVSSPTLFAEGQAAYEAAQRYVYDEFRDVLPLRLSEEEFQRFAGALPWSDEEKLARAFTFLTGRDRERAAQVGRSLSADEQRIQRMMVV